MVLLTTMVLLMPYDEMAMVGIAGRPKPDASPRKLLTSLPLTRVALCASRLEYKYVLCNISLLARKGQISMHASYKSFEEVPDECATNGKDVGIT